jgi:hypothetical protein
MVGKNVKGFYPTIHVLGGGIQLHLGELFENLTIAQDSSFNKRNVDFNCT